MKISQISVFLENKKGRILEVCEMLGQNQINVCSLTIADTKDYGIMRILVDQPEKALEAIKKAGGTIEIIIQPKRVKILSEAQSRQAGRAKNHRVSAI